MSFKNWWQDWTGSRFTTSSDIALAAWEAGQAELLAPMECGHSITCMSGCDCRCHKGIEVTCNCGGGWECGWRCAICELNKVKAERDNARTAANGITDYLAQSEERVAALRKLLWLNHARYAPYLHLPYGDDGQMQCCGIDFKNWSVEDIEKHLYARSALLAPTVPPETTIDPGSQYGHSKSQDNRLRAQGKPEPPAEREKP